MIAHTQEAMNSYANGLLYRSRFRRICHTDWHYVSSRVADTVSDVGGYLGVVVMTFFAPPEIIGIAYDSGV